MRVDAPTAWAMAAMLLSQAAEAVGMNRSSILRAIKAGKISATRDEHDQWQIEPAELHRVYPAVWGPLEQYWGLSSIRARNYISTQRLCTQHYCAPRFLKAIAIDAIR